MKARVLLPLAAALLMCAGCASVEFGGTPYKEFNSETGEWQDVFPGASLSSEPKQKQIDLKPSRE